MTADLAPAAPARETRNPPRTGVLSRAFWVRQFLAWHWISAALSLIGMILFAITGITLNHAADITAQPVVRERQAALPAPLLAQIQDAADDEAARAPLPTEIAQWIDAELSVRSAGREAEWSSE